MKTDRQIAVVKALLVREQRAGRIAQLTSLLVILQGELILELQKSLVKVKKVA